MGDELQKLVLCWRTTDMQKEREGRDRQGERRYSKYVKVLTLVLLELRL